jgi:hypothetical protein
MAAIVSARSSIATHARLLRARVHDIAPIHNRRAELLTSRALPWFESYADQDRTIRMFLRNAGNEEAMMAPDMIGFMESVV